jgi:hypothetical protein
VVSNEAIAAADPIASPKAMIEPIGERNASAPAGTTARQVSPYLARPSTGASMKAVWSMATMRIRPSSRSSRCILRFILRSPSNSS